MQIPTSSTFEISALEQQIKIAADALLNLQQPDGHWCFELEADCTIPSEYILMMHFLDVIDDALQQKITVYIRRKQNEQGGWPLYHGGSTDLSCSIKCYFALKLAGDDPEDYHMMKARKVILEQGGAAKSNVFTRIMLASFEQVPWRAAPFIPVELILLPKWFPFHIYKVSYWSRTVMIPLTILYSLKATAVNPRKIDIQELFLTKPNEERHYHPVRSRLNWIILQIERLAYKLEPYIPTSIRQKALQKAEHWMKERLNGHAGLGAIFPAMVNAYEALLFLGYPPDDQKVTVAREALEKLLVIREQEAYCQPCVSPVWDTLLASCALQETNQSFTKSGIKKAMEWLQHKQLKKAIGDWRVSRPNLPNGSWPFQYENDYYPDLDDTAFVAFAMHRQNDHLLKQNIELAANWLAGMQSKNGGFAAFDVDNTHYYLNEIPFADHGALLDPPTIDVSARCLMLFGCLEDEHPNLTTNINACLDYILKKQEADGSWFGRWGTNYIYGTWSVLFAFEQIGIPQSHASIRKAISFLKKVQRQDGSWGEDNDSYYPEMSMNGRGYRGTVVQTAWALLGLMAGGAVFSDAVQNGIQFLMRQQNREGLWEDWEFNAPGFPKVFYLKYHGYAKYFPLWALARYRNLINESNQ